MAKLYDVFVKTPTKNLSDSFTYKHDGILEIGSLVKVSFSGRETFGIVYRRRSNAIIPFNKINEIKKILSTHSILHERAFALANWMSLYYATPIGDVLFSMIPIPEIAASLLKPINWQKHSIAPNNIHISGSFSGRLIQYLDYINISINSGKQVLLLFANYRLVEYAIKYFSEVMGAENTTEISDRLGRKEFRKRLEWLGSKKIKLVIGTRKSIFLPFNCLDTIIIDQPANYGYYNDQKPAYTSTRIAWKLSELFNIKLILGDNLPDLKSILYARQGKLQLKNIKHKNTAKLVWQVDSISNVFGNLSSNLNLIVTPYLDALKQEDSYSISAGNIKKIIKNNNTIISSKEQDFKLPPNRPFTVIATKKIIDYPELVFDNSIIVGTDLWLSLPSHDAAMEFICHVWQIWQQTKNTLVIQSPRSIPLVERLLSKRPGQALAQFMQSRQKFNLPPYRQEVVITASNIDKIMKILPGSVLPSIYGNTITAYYKPDSWPPKNINDLYRLSKKITIDRPM